MSEFYFGMALGFVAGWISLNVLIMILWHMGKLDISHNSGLLKDRIKEMEEASK